MPNVALLYAGIVLVGSIAPLLTFASLWQRKEWRIDRLREHCSKEGWARQLLGIVRPAAFAAALLAAGSPHISLEESAFVLLLFFPLLTVVQCVLRRQPKPVWTAKAMLMVLLTLSITLCTTGLAILLYIELYPQPQELLLLVLSLIVVGQPLCMAVVWALLWPVDYVLKKRIMRKAQNLRERHPNLTVIGVTGSVGKTTTKDLLQHVLKDRSPLVTPAHVNADIGVARWMIQKLQPKKLHTDTLVVEMGAYRPGEIQTLCSFVQPNYGVLTYVGQQHIALFGSQQALQKAKGELLDALPQDGKAFLNADSTLCAELADSTPCLVTTVGTGGNADLEAQDIQEHAGGIRFSTGSTLYDVPIHGTHNVTNVLLAIAVAESLGMPSAEIAGKLSTYTPQKQTFQVRTEGNVQILDDTHNASPASLRAAIQWANDQPTEHKILLTSGLIELGKEQDQIHTELGELASTVFERVVFTQETSRRAFAKGYGKHVELLGKFTAGVPKDNALLVCIGRMNQRTIQKMIPHA